MFPDGPRLTKVIHSKSDSKNMIGGEGKSSYITAVPFVGRKTVHILWYITIWLQEVVAELRKISKTLCYSPSQQHKLAHSLSNYRLFEALKKKKTD